ncbi:MAG: phosphotransferase [Mycobacteriales bacterium]
MIEGLARLHARYRGDAILDSFPAADGTWWRTKCIDSASRLRESDDPSAEKTIAYLQGVADDPVVLDLLDRTERTLNHGDVHVNNVRAGPVTKLVDWGAAWAAPPAFDLAFALEPADARYVRYAAAWAEVAGRPPDDDRFAREHTLVVVAMNTRYLRFALARFGADAAAAMIETAALARRRLAG